MPESHSAKTSNSNKTDNPQERRKHHHRRHHSAKSGQDNKKKHRHHRAGKSAKSKKKKKITKPTRLDRVIDDVYVGGADWCTNKKIKHKSFTHVVCIGCVGKHAPPNVKGVKLLVERMPDSRNHYISKNDFTRVVSFIEKAMKEKGSKLLLHCRLGVSRSVTFACAYMMKRHGYTEEGALEELKKKHPKAKPNVGFLEQLEAWNHSLFVKEIGGTDQEGYGKRETFEPSTSGASYYSGGSSRSGSRSGGSHSRSGGYSSY